MKNKLFFIIAFCLTLSNISMMLACNNLSIVKRINHIRNDTNHVVKVEINLPFGNETIYESTQRIKILKEIADSHKSSKNVRVLQLGYTIHMTVEQKKLNTTQAQEEAKRLVTRIKGNTPLEPQIAFIARKRCS